MGTACFLHTLLPGSLHNAGASGSAHTQGGQTGRSHHRTSAPQGPDDHLLDSLLYQFGNF